MLWYYYDITWKLDGFRTFTTGLFECKMCCKFRFQPGVHVWKRHGRTEGKQWLTIENSATDFTYTYRIWSNLFVDRQKTASSRFRKLIGCLKSKPIRIHSLRCTLGDRSWSAELTSSSTNGSRVKPRKSSKSTINNYILFIKLEVL